MELLCFKYTKQSAPLFEKALPVCFNENDADRIVDFVKDRVSSQGDFKLLDLGVGTGQVFIPIYKRLKERVRGCRAFVVDSNVHMLNCFKQDCLKHGIDVDTIKIFQEGFEDFIRDEVDYLKEHDIILMTRVLHQVCNWHGFLEELTGKWDSRGVFVFTESFGDLYCALNFVEPRGDSERATAFFQLLNDVFGTGHQMFFERKGKTKISAIDMQPVKAFFESKGFRVEKMMEIKWTDSQNSWSDYLEFIRKRVFAPIFAPFSNKEREYEAKICLLEKKMRETFKKLDWDLNAPVNEELSVLFYCCSKHKDQMDG